MRQKMIEQMKKNEKENAVFTSMLNQNLIDLENSHKDVFNEKFSIKSIDTLTKKEMKMIVAEY